MIPGFFHACLLTELARRTEKVPGSFLALPTCKGVILFADATDRPIQLLMASNIRRTVRSRLSEKNEEIISKRTDLTQVVDRVYFVPCYNDFTNMLTCYRLAKKIYPDSYSDVVKLPKQNYVRINLTDKWPIFSITENPVSSDTCNEKIFGPFPTRKAATDFIGVLNNVFELCQKPSLVDSPEKAKSCPYLQMKTCPAPCVENISYQQYRKQINNAAQVAGGDLTKHIDNFKTQMKMFAVQMKFEKANQGATIIAMRIDLFDDPIRFKSQMDEYVNRVRNLQPLKGFNQSYMAGGREETLKRKFEKEGIPVGPRHQEALEKIGSELDVKVPW